MILLLLEKLGVKLGQILRETDFEGLRLGLCDDTGFPILTYLDDVNFVNTALENPWIKILITSEALADSIKLNLEGYKKKIIVIEQNPKALFFELANVFHSSINSFDFKSVISSFAQVSPHAYVSERGVEINEGVIVEAGASILAGSIIGGHSIIRGGAVICGEQLEVKTNRSGNVFCCKHAGGVEIGNRVEISYQTIIDRGFFLNRSTVIGDDTKIGSHCLIGHNTVIGDRNLIMPGVVVGGSCNVGDDVWIGANSTLRNKLALSSGAHVMMGSCLMQSLGPDESFINGRLMKSREAFND